MYVALPSRCLSPAAALFAPPAGLLLPLLAWKALGQGVEGEGASLAELASHDGEIFFAGAVRKTIPPNATAVTPQSAVPCPCRFASSPGCGPPRLAYCER